VRPERFELPASDPESSGATNEVDNYNEFPDVSEAPGNASSS
jgi:hypothetical protein